VGEIHHVERQQSGIIKAVPHASLEVAVSGTDGIEYSARFVSHYTPAVGDIVALVWAAGEPIVIGKVGASHG
jgi:hypothetical protein